MSDIKSLQPLFRLLLLGFSLLIFACSQEEAAELKQAENKPVASSTVSTKKITQEPITEAEPELKASWEDVEPAPDNELSEKKSSEQVGDYQEIKWVDLIPKKDLDILMNPPESIYEIEDGSAQDRMDGGMDNNLELPEEYQQALKSTNVKAEFNNRKIRIPGFIVPLMFSDTQVVTTFFLVPYFGACIHQPPPPPNQMIYAQFEPGKKLEVLYDAFWIEGTLSTAITENDMGTAAYTMVVDKISPYEVPEPQ